jgi:hypothetical protein
VCNKKAGCGTNHEYTNYTSLQCKILQVFYIEKKSSTFVFEIMTLLSPSNNTDSDVEFMLWGRPFIYIMNNKDTRIDLWGSPCFNVPQAEKKIFCCIK